MRSKAEMIKKAYPIGTRICCDHMSDDPRPIEPGTLGTVRGVDDAGQVMVVWDNGRGLSLIPGVDSFHIVQPKKEQSAENRAVNIESLSAVKKLIDKLTNIADEMVSHLGRDIQDYDIDEMIENEDIRSHVVGAVAEILDSRPEVDMVQINDIGVPFQNAITVTPTAVCEEQLDDSEGQNMEM